MSKSKFTYEYCKAETSKMVYYSELTGTSLHQFLLNKGKKWHVELTSHLIRKQKPKGTYTYEYCKAETQKLTYYNELQGTTLYGVLQKNPKWLKELTKHLIKQQLPRGYWLHNKENCRKEAIKYQTRTEFLKGSPSAYSASFQNNWLNELCSHMKYVQLPNGYWEREENNEKLLIIAKKYKTQKEWLENDSKTFNAARKLPIFEECIKHMKYIFKPNGWWTYDRCKKALLKYKMVQEVIKSKDKQAYVRAKKDGWAELYSHFISPRKPNGYYTLEQCKKDASIYTSRTEVIKNNSGLYRIINLNNWGDICFAHMKRIMTLKERHIYAFEFPDNHVYVGLTCQVERRKAVHLGHDDKKRKMKSPVYRHIYETKLIPEFKLLTPKPIPESDAPKKEKEIINSYKNDGWILLNKAKAGSLGSMRIKWTLKYVKKIASKHTIREDFNKEIPPQIRKDLKERGLWNDIISHMQKKKKLSGEWNDIDCINEAKKYKTKSEFQSKKPGAYKYAVRNNLLNKLFINTKNIKKEIHENFENCKKEALKYDTIGEFRNGSRSYYNAAKRLGFLNEICHHMKRKPISYWKNKKHVHQDALKYNQRWEWGKNSNAAYQSALKYGWIEEVCAHMNPISPNNK